MGSKRFSLAVGLSCIVALGAAQSVRAQEKPVVDQLLDILLKNKEITTQQYQNLKDQAEREQQEKVELQQMKRKADQEREEANKQAIAAAVPTPSPDTMRAYFKNGFNLETADGNFKLAIGGFTQLDWNVSDPDAPVKKAFKLTGTSTGVEFRRARLYLAGLVYGNIDFKFEYDFAEQTGGQPSFKDVYVGMNQIPVVQYFRIGHFKEPFQLETLTSDNFTTFQERGLPYTFAAPGSNFPISGTVTSTSGTERQTGFAAYQNFFAQHMTTAAGAFRYSDNFANGFGTDSPYDISARVTGLPLYDAGQDLVHLGFSYKHSFRHYNQGSQETIQFASRPEAHLFPANLVNTGFIPTDGVDLFNPELAFVTGPFAMKGEYTWALVDLASQSCSTNTMTGAVTCVKNDRSNPMFGGGYIEASYFLTPGDGLTSSYKTAVGYFDRIIPVHNFNIDGSHWGAWQVAARYSYLNLQSASINNHAPAPNKLNSTAGALDDITGGVNWYLNPVMKVTVNYVWAHRESIGDSNIVEGRFQLSF